MIVELTKPWRGWRAGHRFPIMAEGQANLMVKRGVARLLTDEQASADGRTDVPAGNARRGKGSRKSASLGE